MDPPGSGSRTCKSIWDNYYYTRAVCSLFGTLYRTEERCAVTEIASLAFRGICLVIQVCYMTNLNGQGMKKLQSKRHAAMLHIIPSYLNQLGTCKLNVNLHGKLLAFFNQITYSIMLKLFTVKAQNTCNYR